METIQHGREIWTAGGKFCPAGRKINNFFQSCVVVMLAHLNKYRNTSIPIESKIKDVFGGKLVPHHTCNLYIVVLCLTIREPSLRYFCKQFYAYKWTHQITQMKVNINDLKKMYDDQGIQNRVFIIHEFYHHYRIKILQSTSYKSNQPRP